MRLLPTNLAPVADIASAESPRWAMGAVRLRLLEDGGWEATATNGKRAVIVTGPAAAPADESPLEAVFANVPNGKTEALIQAATWASTFKAAAKLTKRAFKPALRAIGVVIGENDATFAATDCERNMNEKTLLVEGRFPDVHGIMPKSEGAAVRFDIDATLLAETLKSIMQIVPQDKDGLSRRVTLEFFRKGDDTGLLAIRAKTAEGLKIDAVIVPLTRDPLPKDELQRLQKGKR